MLLNSRTPGRDAKYRPIDNDSAKRDSVSCKTQTKILSLRLAENHEPMSRYEKTLMKWSDETDAHELRRSVWELFRSNFEPGPISVEFSR